MVERSRILPRAGQPGMERREARLVTGWGWGDGPVDAAVVGP